MDRKKKKIVRSIKKAPDKKINADISLKIKNKGKKKQSRLVNIALVIVMVIGLAIIIYPAFSNWWNMQHMTRAIASYVEEVEKIDDGGKQEMLDEAVKYNSKLSSLDFTLTDEEYAEYESVLDVSGTGIMGYIQIPVINVNLPIYHGTEEKVLSIAVGHIAGTAIPVGGKGTHSVLSGHRGLPSAKLFSDLDLVKEGDIFTISVLDEVLTYQVDQIHIVLPEEISDLAVNPNEDYVTLITCTPYGVNTHRILVRGKRIDNIKEASLVTVTSEAVRISPSIVILAIAVPAIIIAMIISFLIPKNRDVDINKVLKDIKASSISGGNKDEK